MEEKKITTHVECDHDVSSQELLWGEVAHHIPYAIFSLSFGMILLSMLDYVTVGQETALLSVRAHDLFHSFHFLHIIFAVTGSLITFLRYSNKVVYGILVALFSGMFFCTLSDIIFPYLAARVLGASIHLHVCMFSELNNILPFLVIGLLNGFALSRHKGHMQQGYALGSHFGHILVSSLASLFYLIAEGFTNWYPQMGLLFVFLMVAIVLPCTLADVVVPVLFARLSKK